MAVLAVGVIGFMKGAFGRESAGADFRGDRPVRVPVLAPAHVVAAGSGVSGAGAIGRRAGRLFRPARRQSSCRGNPDGGDHPALRVAVVARQVDGAVPPAVEEQGVAGG
ncbi:hypothetical protein G6F46_014892 [Rhizopus delemar]|nr:hypothetical protein G6F46_014892 [Rhizopus delemar]